MQFPQRRTVGGSWERRTIGVEEDDRGQEGAQCRISMILRLRRKIIPTNRGQEDDRGHEIIPVVPALLF